MTHHPEDLASVTAANRDRLMGLAAAVQVAAIPLRQQALSLAKTSRRLSWEYRRGAEADTNPQRAAHWISEARRLRKQARDYIEFARRH